MTSSETATFPADTAAAEASNGGAGAPPVDSRASDRTASPRRTNWYGAFWRWHFYGSIIVIPVLFALTISGLVYMFRADVDSWTHPGVLTVEVPASAERAPLSAQEAVVREAFPNRPVLSVVDQSGDRATQFVITRSDGERATVYVDPYALRVTGSLTADDRLSDWAERVHGDLLMGDKGFGDRIVELGASWSIVLTITGFIILVLGRKPRAAMRRKGLRGARLRGWHTIVGVPVGLGLLLLVVSGLPWTGVWGAAAQQFASTSGGSLWSQDPGATSIAGLIEDTDGTTAPAGWAIGLGPEGTSTNSGPGTSITVDQAVAAGAATGAPGPYSIIYPKNEQGVFSVMGSQWKDNGNPAESEVHLEQTVHVDQYTGQVVGTYGYDDYSVTAQVVSQGVAIHEGRRFGVLNAIWTVLFCLAVLFMCVSGPIMWWKRRGTAQGLAAPRAALPVWGNWLLFAAMVVLGVALPLFGLSLLVILALDQLVIRRVPRLRRLFASA